jgi:dynein heavy chain
LITIEVHNRDITEFLQKTTFSPTSFDWLKQLRFTGQPQGDAFECRVE